MSKVNDMDYLAILTRYIQVCANYKPKLGHGAKAGYRLDEFQRIYRADPFYNWLGLDNPLMYAAHKVAGGMTSIYRQIGIGCEFLFRRILQDHFTFCKDVVGYDLAGFFQRNSLALKKEVEAVLTALLTPS